MKRIAVFAVLALMTALLSTTSQAVAAHGGDLTIQVSNPILVGDSCNPDTFKGCRSGESMRFLAPALNVHKGDTLTFDFAGFHTSTLLPVGTDFLVFRASMAGGVGKPYSMFKPDPDDSTAEGAPADRPALKDNPAASTRTIGGAPADCGTADDPCDYDGGAVVNSGLPLDQSLSSFTVTVDADPGESFWVICLLHTHMNLRINVVANSAATTTQEQIDSTKASMIALDQEWANETDARLLRAKSSRMTANGRVHDVKVGVDNHFANLNAFYPTRLSVRKGETVRYHWNNLVYEDHTATMPAPSAFSLFDEFFVPGCDPDGDTGAQPDTPFGEGPPCGGDFSKIETDISSRVMWGTGNGNFTGRDDLEHSGIRGAQFSSNPYDVKFRARSGDRAWRVICLIHPMDNRVVVK
jgi:plastocyanin